MIEPSKPEIPERFRNHPLFNELHCGVNLGFMAKRGYYSKAEVLKQPELMSRTGVNWCILNANLCQETFYSRKVFLDFRFSSGEIELAEITKTLHAHGIRVILKPCLTLLDGAWMGRVDFPSSAQIEGVHTRYWEEWFGSFTESARYFADFAEKNAIEGLIIGAEYYGTEGRSDEWRNVIQTVRSAYSGPISYEFTCASRKAYPLDWFEDLDFLSYSYYPPACGNSKDRDAFKNAPDVTLEEMIAYLQPRKARILSICERFGNKPVAFTELGVRSAHGCIANPCDFQAETYYDGKEQANYMEAIFRTFKDIPQWLGLYWWKWDETQNRPHYHTDPAGDKGFTIQGKPAEAVLKKWFAARK
ncbi:MAG: hypothetical protein BWY31_03851 [Lentisphaerae bacterium ADurb.Bin242]|nr:MAG: hypothetical protein BWY31_03851 [Lentisphaerae bacterium ADurb.Bin242]